jgi:glycosyltransferase involved in cell wall biosynthesis
LSETEQIKNFTGFGLYDQSFIRILNRLHTPYPYFRGLVAEFGTNRIEIPYTEKARRGGKSHNNLYTLYDYAMLGFANHSKVPLRLASFLGFSVAFVSFLIGIAYLIYKLVFWNSFQVGVAPIVIGLFLFSSVQLICIGIVGEYIGLIFTQVKDFPLVIEKERVNFDVTPSGGSARPA